MDSFNFLFIIRTLKVGDPSDDNTKMGPVVSKEHKNKIDKYIELAQQNGNEVIVAGIMDENIKKSNKGYFIMPTVILNVDDESKLMTEEIFGPIVCVVPFDTEDEVKFEKKNNFFRQKKKEIFMLCRLLNE